MKGKASFLIAWLLNTLGNGQDWDSSQMLSFVFLLCFMKQSKRNYSWEKRWILKDDR